LLGISEDLLQFLRGMVDQFARDDKPLHAGGGQLEFYVAEHALTDSHQAPGAGLLITGVFGNPLQTVIGKKHLHTIRGEILLLLSDDAAFGVFEDQEQVVFLQRMTDHTYRQAADKFRLETEFDKILSLSLSENLLD